MDEDSGMCHDIHEFMKQRMDHLPGAGRMRRWAAILALPVFLVGTAIFSFLWNVPLHQICQPLQPDRTFSVLLYPPLSGAGSSLAMSEKLAQEQLPMLEHYLQELNNAGHISLMTYVPQGLGIRAPDLYIFMQDDRIIFNFKTKYGPWLQTTRSMNSYDRMIFQWMRSVFQYQESLRPRAVI